MDARIHLEYCIHKCYNQHMYVIHFKFHMNTLNKYLNMD